MDVPANEQPQAAEKPAAPPPAQETGRKPKKKKSQPTNCAQSNKRIRRKDWYYRDGKYFANKQCSKLYQTQEAEKAKKAQEAAAAASATKEEKPVG